MPTLREQIRMTEAEVSTYLQGKHIMNVATNGPDGFPHLVAMWYGFIDDGTGSMDLRHVTKSTESASG